MNVLISGASGFIGRHLAHALRRSGASVRHASRDAAHSVLEGPEPDWFIHAASATTPSTSIGAPVLEIDANLRPLASLIEALSRCQGTRVLFLSSAGTVYASPAATIADEQMLPVTRSYHGAMKLASEHFLQAWALQEGRSVIVVRPSNIYGPGQLAKPGFGIIPTAMRHCADGTPLPIWGSGRAVRDYLHVDDLVDLCLQIVGAPPDEAFLRLNASSGKAHSLLEVIDHIAVAAGRPIHCEHLPARSIDPPYTAPSSALANARYGWTPRVDLPSGIAATWAWFSAQSSGA